MISIDYGYATHPGLKRQRNEDSYCVEPDLSLWGVADGMGGHASGEVASGIVVRELPRLIRQGQDLPLAIREIHSLIQRSAAQGKGGADMGSTVVAAKLDGTHYQIAWVGDSRAYFWNGALRQLTRDHSYVQLLLEAGLIEESEMAGHPARNIISQALGGPDRQEVQVDVVSGELAPGESLLLCSDGLNSDVSDEDIAAVLDEVADDRVRANRLVEAALAAGGSDNITVVLLTAAESSADSTEDDEITRPPAPR
ncbi:MAG: protein phosphatase [Proteobacteria bacterium]|nr:protein phosphatase [Pseudomonadota bacterium]